MAEIYVGNGDFERALKKFRYEVEKEGTVRAFKNRSQGYLTKSQKRRLKRKIAQARLRKWKDGSFKNYRKTGTAKTKQTPTGSHSRILSQEAPKKENH